MASDTGPADDKEAMDYFTLSSVVTGIALFICSVALGNIEAHSSQYGPGFLFAGPSTGLAPYAIPAQLGVFIGPISVIGGILVHAKKGLKFAFCGTIGVMIVSSFSLVLSLGLFANQAVLVSAFLIDLGFLFCFVSGAYGCDYLLKLKESRFDL